MAEPLPAPTAPAGAPIPDRPSPSSDRPRRALVIGGGGSTGHAWAVGVLAGLADAGLDVTDADVVIGTSSGATVAAQVRAVPPTELCAQVLAEMPAPGPGPASADGGSPRTRAAEDVMRWTSEIIDAAADPADMRRRLGAAFLERAAGADHTERWRAAVESRLPTREWPSQRLLVVAVDAHTGEPVVFDRSSGVDLVDAVAASTSNGWTYGIAGRRYLNGGYRRNENADLAAGQERVLVLSPFGGRSRHPAAWRMQLSAQLDDLRAGGSRVEVVVPDADAEHLSGAAAMDLTLRPAAARRGHDQGRVLAEPLAQLWR